MNATAANNLDLNRPKTRRMPACALSRAAILALLAAVRMRPRRQPAEIRAYPESIESCSVLNSLGHAKREYLIFDFNSRPSIGKKRGTECFRNPRSPHHIINLNMAAVHTVRVRCSRWPSHPRVDRILPIGSVVITNGTAVRIDLALKDVAFIDRHRAILLRTKPALLRSFVFRNQQHRAGRLRQHFVRRAAQHEQPFEHPATVRTENHQVDLLGFDGP